MRQHTKVYFKYFNYKVPEDCQCEICGSPAVDIHHIEARGMGGNPNRDKDSIVNLMALCRSCHIEYGDVPEKKDYLKQIHNLKLKK